MRTKPDPSYISALMRSFRLPQNRNREFDFGSWRTTCSTTVHNPSIDFLMSVAPVIRKRFSTLEISPNIQATTDQPERFNQQLRIDMVGHIDADTTNIDFQNLFIASGRNCNVSSLPVLRRKIRILDWLNWRFHPNLDNLRCKRLIHNPLGHRCCFSSMPRF